MKKLLLILLLSPIISFAQEKIDGIGAYKINKSIVSALDTMGIADGLTEVIIDSSDEYNFDAPFYSKHKIFKLAQIYFPSFTLKDITLEYYNDTLFSIYIHDYDKEFEDILTAKYGDPKVVTKSKGINCIYKLTGAKTQEEAISWTRYYRNDKITANTYLSKDFDDKCQPTYFQGFFIYDVGKQKKVMNLENIAKAKYNLFQKNKKQHELLLKSKGL